MRPTLGLVMLALLLGGGGCAGGGEASTEVGTPTATGTGGTQATVTTPGVTGEVAVGSAVWAIASVPAGVWVQVDPPVDAMVRVDTSSLKVTAQVGAGRRGAFDGQDLWIARGDALLRTDPQSGEVRGTIPRMKLHLSPWPMVSSGRVAGRP